VTPTPTSVPSINVSTANVWAHLQSKEFLVTILTNAPLVIL